jgi:hypothetical protein
MSLSVEKVNTRSQRGSGACYVYFSNDPIVFAATILPKGKSLLQFSDECVLSHEFGHLLNAITLRSMGYSESFIKNRSPHHLKAHELMAWLIGRELSPKYYNEERAMSCLETHSVAPIPRKYSKIFLKQPLKLTKDEITKRFFAIALFFS